MSDLQSMVEAIGVQAIELQRWQDDGGRCYEQGVLSDAQIVVEAAHMMSDLAVRPAEVILSAFGRPGYGRGFSERVLFDVAAEIAENYDYFDLLSYEQARVFVGQLVAAGVGTMTGGVVRRHAGRFVLLAVAVVLAAGVAVFGQQAGAPARRSVPYPSQAWCETAMSTWTQETFAHKPAAEQLEEVMCEWLTQDGHRYGPARVAPAGAVRPSRQVLAQNAVVAAVNGYCRSYGRYAWVTVNRVTHAVSAGCVKAGSVYPS